MIEINCAFCQKPFKHRHNTSTGIRIKRCSTECYYKDMTKRRSETYQICKRCNTNKKLIEFEKLSNRNNYRKTCKECRKTDIRELNKRYKSKFGYSYSSVKKGESKENFLNSIMRTARTRAKSKNREFDLDLPFLVDLYNKQNGKCVLSGKTLTWHVGKGHYPDNITIDRKDSSKGYTKDNVQLLSYMVNTMKWNFDLNYFLETCKQIIKHNEGV